MKKQKGFAHVGLIVGIFVVVGVVGFAGWRVSNNSSQNSSTIVEESENKIQEDEGSDLVEEVIIKEEVAIDSPPSDTPTSPTAQQPPAQVQTPAPEPQPVQGCGGSNSGVTNTGFMSTETYIATNKFKAALEFAGLTAIADSDKTVVFTMTDSVFDSISADKLAYMNQSPENMKSVLGWHIVNSCQTYEAVFMDAKSSIVLQTLNGPVTYTTDGLGKVESAEIAIWDWFTSNGAVHYIRDYIKPPQI